MSSVVYVVLCAASVFDVGVTGYEQFKIDVDSAEKPEEYTSLRDYASPNLRSYFASPFANSAHLEADLGRAANPSANDLHSYPSMKNFFVNKQLVALNPAEKKTPHWMKMSAVDKRYPFHMPKPYSLTATMEKPSGNIYSALKMYATAFLPMKLDKQISLPLFISKPTSYSTGLKDRFIFGPLSTEKPFIGLKIPIEQYEKRVPIPPPALPYSAVMEKYPIYVPHDKLIPVSMEKPYSIQYQIEKPMLYPMYPIEKGFPHPVDLPVPIRIPIEVPTAPVNIAMTRHQPLFIPVEEPKTSSKTDQDTLAFKPQLFMSTALLHQLAVAQANASVHRPSSSKTPPPRIDENADIESEGTDIVNEYESLKTDNKTITTTATTSTTALTTTSEVVVPREVNVTTSDTLGSTNQTQRV